MKKEYKLVKGEIYYVYDIHKFSSFAMLGRVSGNCTVDSIGCYRSDVKCLIVLSCAKPGIRDARTSSWSYYHKGSREFRLATSHEKRFFEEWERTGILKQQITTSYLRWFLNHEKWK